MQSYPVESKEYNMTSRGQDVPWRWWPGENFEEEWNATSKAGGARIEVLRKYYPRAFERMSTYQRGRLTIVELPKTKSSDITAEPMFCDSCILDRQDHCVGFTNCVEYTHHTGQRFWFCDDCSKCYHERLSQGKNIHFDEEEWAKEEWTEVKVEEAAEAPKFDPSRYVCNDCNKPFDPTSMYSIIYTADSNPLHYRCHSCNFKRENYWDWRPE
jgi:DNA-directed RNA polymerase subunit RPC12/RpoP